MLTMPEVRVGEPLICGSLGVFPLFSERSRTLDYLLPDEAMAQGMVVRETSEAGSVPELVVENTGETPILMVDGTELRGGKQTRALNTTVLLGGKCETRIPVSCIEAGRWNGASMDLSPGSHCPPSLRHTIKEARVGHRSDQFAVWTAIRRKHVRLQVFSKTGDLSAARVANHEKMEQLKQQFPYPPGANGIVVALCGRVIAIDILDKATTLEKMWSRLQEGMLLDLLEVPEMGCRVTGDIAAKLYHMWNLPWEEVKPVGLGEAYRARDNSMFADVLLHERILLHASASLRFPG